MLNPGIKSIKGERRTFIEKKTGQQEGEGGGEAAGHRGRINIEENPGTIPIES
jgi:hypothetical protein